MGAFAFIFLILFLMGLLATLYYGFLCIPMYLHDQQASLRRPDPERERILVADANENLQDVQVDPTGAADGRSSSNLYPDRSHLDDEEDSAADRVPSPNEVIAAVSPSSRQQQLDAPDCHHHNHVASAPEDCDDVPLRNINNRRQENIDSRSPPEQREPLLTGDEEDGLMSHHNTRPPITEVPQVVVVSRTQPDDSSLKEVVVDMSEAAQAVPAQRSMSQEHPPSHAAVKNVTVVCGVVPQLTHPKEYNDDEQIVVDETSHDDDVEPQPSVEDQHEYHRTPTLRVSNGNGRKISESSSYGWSDEVAPVAELQQQLAEQDAAVEVKEIANGDSNGRHHVCPEVSPTSIKTSNASLSNGNDTDTSDPEVTEYNFQNPGSKNKISNDIIATAGDDSPKQNVRITRYISTEGKSVEAVVFSSKTNSSGEGVGDDEVDDVIEEEHKNGGTVSPRRAPDGDSIGSVEEDNKMHQQLPAPKAQQTMPKETIEKMIKNSKVDIVDSDIL